MKTTTSEGFVNQAGKKIGEWKYYNTKGILTEIFTYSNDGKEIRNGIYKSFYENGTIRAEGIMKDDEFNGPYKMYYENGKLSLEGTKKDDYYNGIYKEFYENGKIRKEGIMKDDEFTGPYKEFYENGIKKIEGIIKSKFNSPYKEYHENGRIKIEGMRINNLFNGKYKEFYDNGKLKKSVTFFISEDGTVYESKLDGEYIEYRENGKIKKSGYYRYGYEIGEWKVFYENGQHIISQDSFSNFKGVTQGNVTNFAFDKPEPLLVEHENFRDKILGIESDIVTLEEGIETVRVADAAIVSSKSRKIIVL
jgi:antitoxin component YwqK of YwqJK toxin-antitoxin module